MIPEVLLLAAGLTVLILVIKNRLESKPKDDTMAALNMLFENGHITEEEYARSRKILKRK